MCGRTYEVERAELRGGLVQAGVGREDRAATLSLVANNTTHGDVVVRCWLSMERANFRSMVCVSLSRQRTGHELTDVRRSPSRAETDTHHERSVVVGHGHQRHATFRMHCDYILVRLHSPNPIVKSRIEW